MNIKKISYIIISSFLFIFLNSVYAFAAMGDDEIHSNIIDSIVRERHRAQQEYQVYKAQDAKMKQTEIIPIVSASSSDEIYQKRKKEAILGVFLLVIAIILSLRMLQLSYKKKVKIK